MPQTWLSSFAYVAVFWVFPLFIQLAAAYLVYISLQKDVKIEWSKVLVMLGLAITIQVLTCYQVLLSTIWDVATDDLAGLFSWGWIIVILVVVVMALGVVLFGKRKLAALIFVPGILGLWQVHEWGTYGATGEWGTTPVAMTEQRAKYIDEGIQGYYQREGEYPKTLGYLMPSYLLVIPTPLIIPGQTWCYEGRSQYYRFGYVYREYFSVSATVRIFASAGNVPVPSWSCEREAAKYQMFPLPEQ